jgi:outer membrane protein
VKAGDTEVQAMCSPNTKHGLLLPLFALLLSLPVQAGLARDGATLSLFDAYQLAERHDAIIASARAQRDAGLEKLPQGRAQLLPSLTLDGSYFQNSSHITSTDEYNSTGYALSLSQPLYRRQNFAAYRQSKLQVANALDSYTLAEHNLLLRISSAYFDVLIAQESLAAAQAKTRATQRSLEQAKRRYEVGKAIVTEIDEARARYDLARAEQIAASNELNIKKETMYKITGPFKQPLGPVRQGIPRVELSPVTLAGWEGLAREKSVAIRIARNNLQLAIEEIDRVRGGHYPTLDLIASYGSDTTSGLSSGDYDTATTQLGLRFQLPLYAGGGTNSKVREALANKEKSVQDLRDAEEQSLLETRQAYMSVTSGLLRVQALEQALHSSESSLNATQKGFQVGKRTLLDVLNAQQQLFETQRDLASAKYGYLNSIMQLRVAAGVVTVDDLQRIDGLIHQ